MKITVFDTETTGKAYFQFPCDHPNQPRMVQIAAVCIEVPSFQQIEAFSLLIKPSGFDIPIEASQIHGIHTEFAKTNGVCCESALHNFANIMNKSHELWAFNIDFDWLILSGECKRFGIELIQSVPRFCAMKPLTDILKIPGPYGFKWPKLNEAYQHFYQKEFSGAHNALFDVFATIDVLKAWNPWKEKTA